MTSVSVGARRLINTLPCSLGVTHLVRSDGGTTSYVGLRCAQSIDPEYITFFQSTGK